MVSLLISLSCTPKDGTLKERQLMTMTASSFAELFDEVRRHGFQQILDSVSFRSRGCRVLAFRWFGGKCMFLFPMEPWLFAGKPIRKRLVDRHWHVNAVPKGSRLRSHPFACVCVCESVCGDAFLEVPV